MMKAKKYIIGVCALFILLILFMGSASAVNPISDNSTDNGTVAANNLNQKNISNYSLIEDNEQNNINSNVLSSTKDTVQLLSTTNKNYYVSNTGNDSHTGSSTDPFLTIAHAVNIINSDSAADSDYTINIASGTYFESGMFLNKNITFQRYGSGEVIIDGGQNQIFTTSDMSGININFINLTLTNATAENGGVFYSGGGPNIGIYDCKIKNNKANGEGGGAIYALYGNIKVTGSEFVNNTATNGGGGAIMTNGNVKVTGSEFVNNTATNGFGGAIFTYISNVNVTGSCFVNNTATSGNAISAGSIDDVSGNWWGNNNPNDNNLVYKSQYEDYYTINSYVIMSLEKNEDTVIVSLKLNNSDTIKDLSDFISRNVNYNSNNIGSLNPTINVTNSTGVSTSKYTYKSELYFITATIDNQPLTITNKNQTSINASLSNTSSLFYGMDDNLTILLYDSDENLLKNMNVSVQINNGNVKIYNTSTDGKGIIIHLKDLAAGEYTVIYNFTETGVYLNSTNKTIFTISPQSTSINTTETSYTVVFGTGADVIVNLYYANGSLFTGETVNCTIYNGSKIVYSENITNGKFTIPSALNVGTYNLNLTFNSNSNYTSCFNSTKLRAL